MTATTSTTIKLDYGVPEIVAFKFLTGKNVEGKYGAQVLFTCDDDRRIYLEPEDGSDVERAIGTMGIQRGDPVTLTKIKHPRGGGHSIRVERAAAETRPDERFEAQLKGSIELARRRRAEGGPASSPPAITTTEAPATVTSQAHSNGNAKQPLSPVSAKFMSAYKEAIDTLVEAKVYAQRQGLAIEIRCEDVRCLAATLIIQQNGCAR
jgi:hypothetical protein